MVVDGGFNDGRRGGMMERKLVVGGCLGEERLMVEELLEKEHSIFERWDLSEKVDGGRWIVGGNIIIGRKKE